MLFEKDNLLPQPSSHATSKPIDINRSIGRQLNERGNEIRTERPKIVRPVNRVKPVIVHNPASENVVHQTYSHPAVSPIFRIPSTESNKENCNRMPAIYNIYAAAPSSSAFRDSNKIFDYVTAPSPPCNCADCEFEVDENFHEDPLFSFPTEFRSVGDIIGYANVIRSQREATLNKFNLAVSTLRRDLQARTLRSTAAQLH
ncbi:hypothetical protein M3Y98_01099700 [Aphelenchoides besseyi]|nr:hypothetical protein M3Y98_01099700 [Aphelenchoides besseyi]KAI6209331.1 hypothetical protein M3Y96_00210400 [Aphelenchoides besseyi]